MKERKIKILHVIDSLGVGGMERVLMDVANGLDLAGFQQTVCCLSRLGEMADQLRDEVRCIDLGKGDTADRFMPLKLARVIHRERPDIVHSQSWSGVDTALATMLTPGVKLIHSEHGRNYPHWQRQPLLRRMARRGVYHLADAVVAISGEVRDFYCGQTGFPTERVQVISNGIDVRRMDEADARGVREELGIAPDDFVFGTVARLDLTKDTITLARAFAAIALPQRYSKLKLLVVGDGEERARLEEFVRRMNLDCMVIFAGMRRDVPRLLRAMDVFALSSVSEGMPLTVLEAMAARLPVVATNVGALPELVEEGRTGFLVPIRHAAAMSDKLESFQVNRQLAKTFGEAARRKVEREFSLERMLQNYAKLYESLWSATSSA
ncbi:MAG: glycosyltransferase [Acidobacteria bacterium]|nr:glycosyltransferase [Acidobacteriota bacterium]